MNAYAVVVGGLFAVGGGVACHSQSGALPDFAVGRLTGVTIPGLPAVTGRIVVDQFGYLPQSDKVAVISDPVQGYNAGESYTPGGELQVRLRRDGKIVHRGVPRQWRSGAVHEDTGDRGWWFDFSTVRSPGEYYIYDPLTQLRSPLFKVGPDVYNAVLRAAVRTYFYQRLSFEIKAPYAESPWFLPALHNDDKTARFVNAKQDAKTARDLSGGWMDAGDTNKYPPFNADALSSLLYAYTENPTLFTDSFGIPESGNGLPDLLDELKYQYDWLVKMQDTDGGVFIKVGNLRDRKGDNGRYYGPKDSGASITFALNCAHAARVFGKFAPWKSFSQDLQSRAERAWTYYKMHPRTTDLDTGEISAGSANRGLEDQDRLEAMAGVHLFALTGKPVYHDAVKAKAGSTQFLGWGFWSPYSGGISEALVDYISLPGADAALIERVRRGLQNSAAQVAFAPPVEEDLYRAWMNKDAYHWGSNNVRASFGFGALLVADHGGIAPVDQVRMRQRAEDLLHSIHGVNPLSVVYLTNTERLGAALSIKRIWHERFNFDTPFAQNPPPGYLPGGPNQQFGGTNGDRPGDVSWIKTQPRGKAYADFNETWPKNSWEITENAIYYQAAYVRLLAGVLKPVSSPAR